MSPNACAAAGWSASGPHVPGRGERGRVQTFLTSYAVDLHSAPFLLLGILLLGGLVGGEAVRRLFNLPRTTGYVLTGIAAGPSGLGWVAPDVLQSAQFFVYLAIGVILFELGHRLPTPGRGLDRTLLGLSLAEINGTFLAVGGVMLALGFGVGGALFAAAVAVSTSPAITIATTSDVGSEGPATDRLLALVAFNNCAAFVALAVALPILPLEGLTASLAGHAPPVAYVAGSLALGTALAAAAGKSSSSAVLSSSAEAKRSLGFCRRQRSTIAAKRESTSGATWRRGGAARRGTTVARDSSGTS